MSQQLDLNLIRVLCAVVEAGTVTQAALRLDTGISAISYGLSKLRQHYNDPIVIRTGNGMEPTVTALGLYKAFKPALELLATTDKSADADAVNHKKTLSIRCNSMFEWRLTHELFNGKSSEVQLPSLDFLYYAVNINTRLELLRKRQTDIDIGFVLEDDSSILKYPVLMQGTVLLCRQDHPRLRDTVSIEELREENLLSWAPPHESIVREMYHIAFEGYQSMNRPYRSSSMINLLLNVQHSDMVIFAPLPFAHFCCNMLSLRAVACPFLPKQFYNTHLHIHKSQKDTPEIQHIIRQVTGWSNG
ncbi:hypothetical protein AV650_08255 [Serratia fonticola]|nr:hypothetical protein AV650_08255 [Serratia fonticola]